MTHSADKLFATLDVAILDISSQFINADISNIKTQHDLNTFKACATGKQSKLVQAFKRLKQLDKKQRIEYGQKLNQIRAKIEQKILEITRALNQNQTTQHQQLNRSTQSLPLGSLHPLQSLIHDIKAVLDTMGFTEITGPDIVAAEANFDILGFDTHHPARASSDTFYFSSNQILRTHTTACTISSMSNLKPPFGVYSIGQAYRNDDEDATHTSCFHQFDVEIVSAYGEQYSVANLKSLVIDLLNRILGKADYRFVSAYFPFTTPSIEVYLDDTEILGCGLLNQEVMRNIGLTNHSCMALGMGIERILSFKQKISDIRELYRFDARNTPRYT